MVVAFFGCVAALSTLERFRRDGPGDCLGTAPDDDLVGVVPTNPAVLWRLGVSRRAELSDFGVGKPLLGELVGVDERAGSPVLLLGQLSLRAGFFCWVIAPVSLERSCGDDLGDGLGDGFAECRRVRRCESTGAID